jgi:hypothetical protein
MPTLPGVQRAICDSKCSVSAGRSGTPCPTMRSMIHLLLIARMKVPSAIGSPAAKRLVVAWGRDSGA